MENFGKDIHHYHTNTNTNTTRLVPYEKTVIEKRAPTDESIKLYNDLLYKVRSEVVDDMKIESCGFIIKGTCFIGDYMRPTCMWKFKTIVNDVPLDFEIEFTYYEEKELRLLGNPIYKQKVSEMVFKKLSEKLAIILMTDAKIKDELKKII